MDSSDRPPLFIYSLSTNFVLEIEGGIVDNGKIRVAKLKNRDNTNQLWILEDSGIIASFGDKSLVLSYSLTEGSPVVVSPRKDNIHNWNQLWEFHRGYVRSKANHNLVLDVERRSANEGASVIVFKPHKHGNYENQQWGLKLPNEQIYSLQAVSPTKQKPRGFDPSKVEPRLVKLWSLEPDFGRQAVPSEVFYNDIVSDRYCLLNGVQVLRDEIQLAFEKGGKLSSCAVDLTQPTVVTTLAHTNCGDRINHSFDHSYNSIVASRFANVALDGNLMVEGFSPAGGGTDDGGVLAHVTVSHQLDDKIRARIYEGNKSSYVLVNIDLMTHVGCDEVNDTIQFGCARESTFRESRSACGAVLATIKSFDGNNVVHNRLKSNLGETNFQLLKKGIAASDGTDITYVVAAAIIAVQGLRDTCFALTNELDERGVAHLTACTTINGTDNMFYFARATVFGGIAKIQGFGLDASKYAGKIVVKHGRRLLYLTYGGKSGNDIEVENIEYTVKTSQAAH